MPEHLDDLIADTQALLTDLEERLHEYDDRRLQAAYDIVRGGLVALQSFLAADGRFDGPEPVDEPETVRGGCPRG